MRPNPPMNTDPPQAGFARSWRGSSSVSVDTLLGIGQAFELDRGMVPQAGVDAFEVVEAFDVAAQLPVELGVAGELVLMYELSFQGVEEALHVGVVLAIARTIHA